MTDWYELGKRKHGEGIPRAAAPAREGIESGDEWRHGRGGRDVPYSIRAHNIGASISSDG